MKTATKIRCDRIQMYPCLCVSLSDFEFNRLWWDIIYRTQLMADASKVAALYAVKSSEKSGRHQDSARRSTRDIEGAIQRSLAAGLFMNSGRYDQL